MKYDAKVYICFPVSVKRIESCSTEEARKVAIEAVYKFFKDPEVDPMYFDNHDNDGAYDSVAMDIEGCEDISISVSSDYKVE